VLNTVYRGTAGAFGCGAVMAWLRCTCSLCLVVLAVVSVPRARARLPDRGGWVLRFADDFKGPAGQLPSPGRWVFDTGQQYPFGPKNWGTQEVERYTRDPDNVSLDGHGNLRITPLRDASGHWTSARIESRKADFEPPPGGILRIEARIRMPDVTGPAALGYWPAFWAMGRSYRKRHDWPASGEFDIMENVNGLQNVWQTLHCGVKPGGPCDEPHGIGHVANCPGSPCQMHFHVYTFEWDRTISPRQLRWYVDGHLTHQVSQAQLPTTTWRQLTHQGGYFILLNVAMGGNFPRALSHAPTPGKTTEPRHPMLVDYVAVWTRDGLGNGGDPQAGASTTRRSPSYPAPVNAAPRQP
jgi:hypothetical protein